MAAHLRNTQSIVLVSLILGTGANAVAASVEEEASSGAHIKLVSVRPTPSSAEKELAELPISIPLPSFSVAKIESQPTDEKELAPEEENVVIQSEPTPEARPKPKPEPVPEVKPTPKPVAQVKVVSKPAPLPKRLTAPVREVALPEVRRAAVLHEPQIMMAAVSTKVEPTKSTGLFNRFNSSRNEVQETPPQSARSAIPIQRAVVAPVERVVEQAPRVPPSLVIEVGQDFRNGEGVSMEGRSASSKGNPFWRSRTFPLAGMSNQQMNAACNLLSVRERSAGRLPQGYCYFPIAGNDGRYVLISSTEVGGFNYASLPIAERVHDDPNAVISPFVVGVELGTYGLPEGLPLRCPQSGRYFRRP